MDKKEHKGLSTGIKLGLILFPFPFLFWFPFLFPKSHGNVSINAKKKKQYWNYMALGYLFWFFAVIFIGRYLKST